MTARSLLLALAVLFGLAACPSTAGNAPVVWLAPNGDELHLQLLPIEPNPF